MTKDETRAAIIAATRKYVDRVKAEYLAATAELAANNDALEDLTKLFNAAEIAGIMAEIDVICKELEDLL